MTLATFLKVNLPSFKGSTNPSEADNWLQAMEMALEAQQVPLDLYVGFATYKLEDDAQFWWRGARRLLL